MSHERVFITGLSALTSCGATADDTWAAMTEGQNGFSNLTHWDISTWTHQLAGEIKNVQPAKMLPDRKLMKVISRQDVMGIYAATQAVEHSQMLTYRDTLSNTDQFNDETGVYVGSPGNKYDQQYDFLPLMAKTNGDMQAFAKQLFSEVHPMWLLRILPNNVLAYAGITYGLKGPNQNITNHGASGMQALLEAYHAIKTGQASRAVVVAYDVPTEPQALFYYQRLGVLSDRHLKPFDSEHDGTILAEGAAAIVLESEASVLARGGKCYAEMAGGLTTTEAMGLFSVAPNGEPLSALMTQLLQQQGLSATDIDLVVAHGNGNEASDNSEAHAIRAVFREHPVPVTAFKGAIGHTVCASGLLDAVFATYALREKIIPGISSLDTLAPACEGLNMSGQAREFSVSPSAAMIINRGFSGVNAAVVIKACE
jgi:3-oxoacyl-[acyl-carrier-protein] synthase-1